MEQSDDGEPSTGSVDRDKKRPPGRAEADETTVPGGSDSDPTTDRPRWKCALYGSAVTLGIIFLFPISPATGGAVAGYLRKGDTTEGIVVGALAGLPPTLPVAVAALWFLDSNDFRVGADATGAFTTFDIAFIWLLLLVFVPLAFAILSGIGGALGVHADEDF